MYMLCLTPENPSSNTTMTSRSAHQVEENLRRHGEEADRPKRFRGWRHHIEDDQYDLSDLLDDQLRVSVGLVVFGQNVVAGRDPLLADHQDDDLEGLHEGCCLLGISWELGPELRSHRCSHIPCELHFCTSDQLTLSRPCREKAKKRRRGARLPSVQPGKRALWDRALQSPNRGTASPSGYSPAPAPAPTASPRRATPAANRSPRTFVPPIPSTQPIAGGAGTAIPVVETMLRGAEGSELAKRLSRGPF